MLLNSQNVLMATKACPENHKNKALENMQKDPMSLQHSRTTTEVNKNERWSLYISKWM